MANIVATSFFTGQLTIAQLTESSVLTNLTAMIDKLEPEFLEKLLGYPLYKLYKTWDGNAVGKYKDLRDGLEYENRFGKSTKWYGFKRSSVLSPIANYIYYWWLRKEVSVTSGNGERKANSAASINMSSVNKQVRAWNEMVEWNKEFWEFMYIKQDIYPEFDILRIDRNLFTVINVLGI
ncbi:conserved hypothetical protein [Gammaproteobacteria bacterium]